MKTLMIYIPLLTCLLLPVCAEEQPEKPDTNPALYYWQAAALLPQISEEKADELSKVVKGELALKPGAIIPTDFDQTIRYLRKAAGSEAPCDWGIDWDEGPTVAVPHLSKIRELSTLVLALAEFQFKEGNTDEGIELLFIAHHIARDLGGEFLIAYIVQLTVESSTIKVAGRHCMEWPEETRLAYLEQFGKLPELYPLVKAFESEVMLVDYLERALAGEIEGEEADEAFKALGIAGPLQKVFMGAMIKGYRSMHAKGVEALSLSGAERRARVKAFEDEIVKSKNVLVGLLMPALSGMVKWDDRMTDLSGMFQLVLRHGPGLDEKKLDGTTFSLAKDENGNVELGASESDAKLPLSSKVGDK